MKKLIGYPATWILYYLSDTVSRIPNFNYPAYNKLMIWSGEVQDWAKLTSPWKANRLRNIKQL